MDTGRLFKNYLDVRAWLETFIPLVYGKEELGLARIEYLLKLLGNPEKKFKSIHVAGTSGKGSTAFYISKMLQLSDESQSVSQLSDKPKTGRPKSDNRKQKTDNWKIGLHISPHLVDIRERMQILECQMSPFDRAQGKHVKCQMSLMPMGRFLKLFKQVRSVVEKILKEKPELVPSYFEILVAASFKYFAEEKVDWAVVEVGLGGRLDATNVLQSRIAVITNIGLDHTEILGDTVEKIAWEKAGIIKPGVPVVTGATGNALGVIEKVAKDKNAPLYSSSGARSYLKNKYSSYGKFSLRSNNNFELAEKAVEVALSLRAERSNLKRDRHGHQDDLAMTIGGLPGRFEEIDKGVIIDGAHNVDKIKALIQWIKVEHLTIDNLQLTKTNQSTVNGQVSIVLTLAFKKGKDWKAMIDLLIKNLPIQSVIATEFNAVTDTGKFSAVPAEEIRSYIESKSQGVKAESVENSQEAVFKAINSSVIASPSSVILSEAKESHQVRINSAKQSEIEIATDSSNPRNDGLLVLVTGSLYLVGEVRTMWKLPDV